MPTTPNRGYRYPAATVAPDVPGDIYNLAMDLDTATAYTFAGFTMAANQSFATGANVLLRIGKVRILHFSILNNFDVEIGSGFLQVPYGDQPGLNVSAGGFIVNGSGVRSAAAFTLQPDRSIVLAAGAGGTGFTHVGTLFWTV